MAEENNWLRKIIGSSAWSSSTSDRSIININLGTQGDVVTGVDGDFIKGVGGNVYKGVHGGITYGEKKIRLPRFVALKAKYNGKCLRLTEYHQRLPAGFLKFEGREVASPQAKFELETAETGNGLVHIRCCYNNKYLVRQAHDKHWIIAAADKPEENKYKTSCTLFEPEPYDQSGGLEFRFRHVQLGMHTCLLRCHIPFYGGLYAGSNTSDKDNCDLYTVVVWESLEKKMNKAIALPRFLALKAMHNSKYMSLRNNHPRLPAGFLKFDEEEVASPLAKFEVEMAMAKSGNGLVHIRSCFNNKYLVREAHDKHWIVAAADKPEEDENKFSCTLFEPEWYDESREVLEIRFRHVQLGMYACLWRTPIPFYGGLYCGSNTPDKYACDVYKVVDLNSWGIIFSFIPKVSVHLPS